MENNPDNKEFELICVIVNYGIGSKVIKIAKGHGVSGGTAFIGKGTIKNRLLELLDLTEISKEIIVMAAEKKTAYEALEVLNKELKLEKPNHGIAFSFPIKDLLGISCYEHSGIKESRGEGNSMYDAIFTIVDKGKAEEVIEAATKAGSKGGTIINARGSGIHETSMLFKMAIEPEKEMVLVLSENKLTETIVASIREDLQINEPGKGIMFILNVNKAYGLY